MSAELVLDFGPLLERGVTFRGPIAKHTWLENRVMNIVLRRYNVLSQEGEWKARAEMDKPISGEEAIEYERYLSERDKIGDSTESRATEWEYLYRRGRRCNPNDGTSEG